MEMLMERNAMGGITWKKTENKKREINRGSKKK
jgi:hypothetical protein